MSLLHDGDPGVKLVEIKFLVRRREMELGNVRGMKSQPENSETNVERTAKHSVIEQAKMYLLVRFRIPRL